MKESLLKFFSSSLTALVVITGCLIVSGCLDADFRLDQSIKEAIAQAQEGNTSAAINKLESLQDKYPNDANIAEALAVAYTAHGNYLLASNYYQKSARLSSEKTHLLKLSADGQIKAGRMEDAAARLSEYLESFPEDGETWLELGRIQYDLQHEEPAMNALTRGILLTNPEDQSTEDHRMLGSLCLNVGDYSQADFYLNSALILTSDDAVEGQVLVDLVRSSVKQEDWDVADVFLKRIAATQPSLLVTNEVRQLQDTVSQIFSLRSVTAESTIKVDVTVPEKEEDAIADDDAESVPEAGDNDASDVDQKSSENGEALDENASVEANNNASNAEEIPVDSTEQTAPDTVDSQPEDADGGDSEGSVSEGDSVEEASLENPLLSPDSESEAVVEVPVEQAIGDVNEETTSTDPLTDGEEETQSGDSELPELDPYVAPENEAELLLIQAQQAIAEGDIASAVRMSWDSINKRPESPAGWFILSRAYTKYGHDLNAESAALEAMRLNPRNKKIVLNYLGIIQRSRGANRFHEELLKAYQGFSTDADFVLALARSYARIKNDPENAAALYRRFFDLAPDHELAAEIRQEATFVD